MDSIDARNYDRGMWLLERLSLRPLRQRVLAKAEGEVLEIGAGTGSNLPLYSVGVRVTAIELRPAHLAAALRKAQDAGRAIVTAAAANAQWLPFGDAVFDTVVGTLVFCSINDPSAALAEIRRVLKPGGRLLLLEHVRGQTPVSRLLTDALHPLWFAMQGECHLNRETARTVTAAGFRVDHTEPHGRGLVQIIDAVAPAS